MKDDASESVSGEKFFKKEMDPLLEGFSNGGRRRRRSLMAGGVKDFLGFLGIFFFFF